MDFLKELLAAGPCPKAEVLRRALHAGISTRTLERAKIQLGVESKPTVSEGRKRWSWSFSASAADEAFIPNEPFTEETARQVEAAWRTDAAPAPG
jgi:hypothetical protein